MWMFPVAIACGNTFVLKPSERDPTLVAAHGGAAEGGRPARRRVQRRPRRQGGGRRDPRPSRRCSAVSFVGSTPIAKYIYETGARHGKRVQALGGAKNHAVVLPDADLEFADRGDHRRGLRLGRRALHGDLGGRRRRRRRRRARRAPRRARARRIATGPGDAPGVEMGPVITCAARDRIARLHRPAASPTARSWSSTGAARDPRPRERLLRRPDAVRPASRRRWRSTARRSSGRCWWSCASASLDDAIALVNAQPLRATAPRCSRARATPRACSSRSARSAWSGVNVPIPVPMAFFSFGGWTQLALRRPARARHGRRALLHPHQGDHRALARRRQRRAGLPHAGDGVAGVSSGVACPGI